MYSDIVINFGSPSKGETSVELVKRLQVGKACFVNEGEWFAEISDECTIKESLSNIEEEMKEKLIFYTKNKDETKLIGLNARNYINIESIQVK